MKIDIGAEGKILGTKRVSPNGQVSGLSEYAGEEVLIIYPGPREPRVRLDARDHLKEMERAVQQHLRSAFVQYRGLKSKYRDEAEAARDFVRTKSPQSFHNLLASVDEWVATKVRKVEDRVAERLGDEHENG